MNLSSVRRRDVWRSLFVAQASVLIVSSPLQAITVDNSLLARNPFESTVYAQEKTRAERIKEALEKGARLYREGKWPQAIDVWATVLELDPQNARAKRYIERAKNKIAQQVGVPLQPRIKPAISPVKPAAPPKELTAQPPTKKEVVDLWLKQGVALYREGRYKEAMSFWNKVLAKDPNNKRAQRYIERALKKQVERPGPTPVAKKMTAEEENAKDAETYLEEGKKLYREGKYKAAIEQWEQALILDPLNLAAKRYITRAKEKLGVVVKPTRLPTPKAAPKPLVTQEKPSVFPFKVEAKPYTEKAKAVPRTVPVPLPTQAGIAYTLTVLPEGEVYNYGTLTLEDCIKLALANYGAAKVSREEIKLAKMRLIEARRGAFPGVNLKNGITEGVSTDEDFEGLEFTAEFQLPIMTGGRLRNSIRQAETNLAVSMKNYEKIRADYVAERVSKPK